MSVTDDISAGNVLDIVEQSGGKKSGFFNKLFLHIAVEVVVIGGVFFYLNKKNKRQNKLIDKLINDHSQLEGRLEMLEQKFNNHRPPPLSRNIVNMNSGRRHQVISEEAQKKANKRAHMLEKEVKREKKMGVEEEKEEKEEILDLDKELAEELSELTEEEKGENGSDTSSND